MDIVEKIKAEIAVNPKTYVSEISRKLGISRQYIYTVCRKNNIKLSKGWRHRTDEEMAKSVYKATERFKSVDHFGIKLSSHFVGGASELTASADLLRKGIPVYRALTFVSSADLIINVDEKLLRVEVRSARRTKAGELTYCASFKTGKFDLLALVEPNGNVTYRPDIFISITP